MNYSQSFQYLKDRVHAIEKEMRDTSKQIRDDMAKNNKVMMGLLLLEAIPTLASLGIPVKDAIPGAIKLLLGFLGFRV
jgi:hypothetical protein